MIIENAPLKAPFPYFGGKSKVALAIWARFGDVPNYVEPFMGSAAVLLARPHAPKTETVNDKDGLLANFWRAVQADPEAVARWADNPVNENDLHARHAWLVGRKESLQDRLEGDPEFFDAKVAGWWVWGISCWIGSGWCSGRGPWRVAFGEDGLGRLVRTGDQDDENGQKRAMPGLGNNRGVNAKLDGVNRQIVHLAGAQGVNRSLINLGGDKGVNRKMPEVGSSRGVTRPTDNLLCLMQALSDRLRGVRVCCGDWARVCGPTPTIHNGLTAILLDPPYADTADRHDNVYRMDSNTVAHEVREWAIAHGDDPMLRIALCGYEGEHAMPDSWETYEWKATGGYGSQSQQHDNPNARRERIWFNKSCLKPGAKPKQHSLLDEFEG